MDWRRRIGRGLAVLATLSGPPALADGPWYVALGLGPAHAALDPGLAAVAGGQAGVVDRDQRDPAFKVLLGHRFGEYLAVEGGYAWLGDFRIARQVSPTDAVSTDLRVKGMLLQGVGRLPLRAGFALVARGGVLLSETKTFRATSGAATFAGQTAGSRIADEFNPAWGVGIEYRWASGTVLRIDWDRYRRVGDPATTGETDLDAYSVGVGRRF